MTWVRIDDGFYQHPKMVRVGPVGMALQIAALCYCNRNLTDGFIPEEVVPLLIAGGAKILPKMVELDLWERVKGGYQVHNYLEYQRSKEQVAEAKAMKQAAGQAGGRASAKARGQAKSNPIPIPIPIPKLS